MALTDLSKAPRNVAIPDKAIGVWVIPDLNVRIPVYSYKLSNPQAVVDAEKSACWQPYCNAYLLSDHAGSEGSWYMERVTLDMEAYFVRPTYTMMYRCYALFRADKYSWGYTQNGSMVMPRSSKDILCSSCVDSKGKEVYLAQFKEVMKV